MYMYVVETVLVPLLLLSFNRLDVLWASPSLPVSLLESCSSATALLWVILPKSFDASQLPVTTLLTAHTVTQAVEDIWLKMVLAWVLVC